MASQRFEDIVADFEFLDEWEDRYRYIIELGKNLAALDDADKNEATKVNGCASQVWIAPRETDNPDNISFDGDSDAIIVKGLIAVLHTLYNNQPAKTVIEIDASNEMKRLGLDQHLSSQRSNGLRAMIERIRQLATVTLQH